MTDQSELDALRGTLIVSCQAYPGEPMRSPHTMAQIAQAVVSGGASAVRAQGIEDIRAVLDVVDIPVIGIWKDGAEGVCITPTLAHARSVAETGAHIVGLDGTLRERPDGRSFAQTLCELRESHDVLVMADCDSLDSALAAQDAGADIIGTTLAGYTRARPSVEGPDLELLAQIVNRLPDALVVAEGRIHTADDARRAINAGAFAVAVGTAITHPTSITRWFGDAVRTAVSR